MPEPLRSYVGDGLEASAGSGSCAEWSRPELPWAAMGQRQTRLLRIRPGIRIPRHTHAGTELTLVLAGGFTDGGGHYLRGDLSFSDGEVDHSPRADDDGECICLTVIDAPLRLTGPLMRLLNPFVRF